MKLVWRVWLALVLGSFVVFETIGIVDGKPNTTLTQVTLHTFPWWIVTILVAVFAWLVLHFGGRVWRNRHGKQDGL